MRFVDTNVLLYAVSTDPAEAEKAALANGVLASREIALSVQVLQEFYVQATRTSRRDALDHALAVELVESFLRFPTVEVSVSVMRAALRTSKRYGVSYGDAAIIEAARAAGCSVVLSEDLSDGQDYGGVRVEDPFRGLKARS